MTFLILFMAALAFVASWGCAYTATTVFGIARADAHAIMCAVFLSSASITFAINRAVKRIESSLSAIARRPVASVPTQTTPTRAADKWPDIE